jgi:hypothetical protein
MGVYCEGCDHWRRLSSNCASSNRACHYAYDTWHCRLCPAEGCPYHTKHQEGVTAVKNRKLDTEAAGRLYNDGMSDAAIGKELGVCSNSVL